MDFKVKKISKVKNYKNLDLKNLKKNFEKIIKKNYKLSIILLVLLVLIGVFRSINATEKITEFVATSITEKIKKNKFNYTNILVTGVGGEKHDGAYLTDSLILASVNPSKEHIILTSIPRDIFIESENFTNQRVNSIYANHQKLGHDVAMGHLSDSLELLLGQEIHYSIMVDFNAVIDTINILDGIQIYNPETIYDPFYPGPNFSYQTFTLPPGYQNLDGDTALKFIRSRKTSSDFARSKRQQQVLIAIKEKATSLNLFAKPNKIIDIIAAVDKNIQTDLNKTQILSLAQKFKDINYRKFTNLVLNDNPNTEGSFIYSPPLSEYNNAYVLVPLDESNQEIKTYIQLNQEFNKAMKFNGKLVVKNGTDVPGLAMKFSQILKRYGFDVNSIQNADSKNYVSTVISNYDLAGSNTLNALMKVIPAAVDKTISVTDPDIPIYTEIIIGQDIASAINEIDSYNQKVPIIIKAQNEYEEFKNKNLVQEITGSKIDEIKNENNTSSQESSQDKINLTNQND
ncbi:LCP family protein [bacterium]|jgi:LCP family protein required for cell wall assembly|nr:LCP family protein [bacterium]MBT6293295.1 LCP family protein [bacterium]